MKKTNKSIIKLPTNKQDDKNYRKKQKQEKSEKGQSQVKKDININNTSPTKAKQEKGFQRWG